jgi:hypothetical protein
LSHILYFFPWRGWGIGIATFWKKLATFSFWFLFGIDFEGHQLVTIWRISSQVPFNYCFEPTTSQEKGHVIITSLILFIYKHYYSNIFKFAPTSVKLINPMFYPHVFSVFLINQITFRTSHSGH